MFLVGMLLAFYFPKTLLIRVEKMKKNITFALLFTALTSSFSYAETTGIKLMCTLKDKSALAVFSDGVSRVNLKDSFTIGLYKKSGNDYVNTKLTGQCTGAIYVSNNFGTSEISNASATMNCGTSINLEYEFLPASGCGGEFGGCFYPETNDLKVTVDGKKLTGRCNIIQY
jgi:hypothetical protein